MLILPHSTALDLEGRPYVTYAVIILCIIVYLFQSNNNEALDVAAENYCASIHDSSLSNESLDVMSSDADDCENMLGYFLYEIEYLIPNRLESMKEDKFPVFNVKMDEVIELMQTHYDEFQLKAPESLNAKLMYYPDSWNPFRTITSALSHGSWDHIIFNLIFFFAFAPALELLIANALKYLGVLMLVALTTDVSYSLVILVGGGEALPSLGLSGVVMGMIGLSAYLMPQAKIRVLFWFIAHLSNYYVPAWILALWYIGWDSWDLLTNIDSGGINLIAHVSGGFAGYFIGYFWLKEIKEDTRDDLDDEIEYQRSKRADRFTSHNVSFSGNRRYTENKQRERQFKKDDNQYQNRLYNYVTHQNDSEAIVLMLEEYDFQHVSVEIYEEQFDRMLEWGASRAVLCMGRVCIGLLVNKKLYKRAIVIEEQCRAITENFVLADPQEVLLLAWGAINLQKYETAYNLIHDAEQRYGTYIDIPRCQLLKVELLWRHLEQLDEARSLMKALLAEVKNPYREEILVLAKSMQNCE